MKTTYEGYTKLEKELSDLIELNELTLLENAQDMVKDILNGTKTLEKEIEKLEIATLLSGKYDKNNAIITLHPGARRNRITRLG